MRIQDFIVQATETAVLSLFRNAEAIPTDKVSWQPAPEARSALDQLQECAQIPAALARMLSGEEIAFTAEAMVHARRERREWTTVAECERVCQFNTQKLCEAIRAFPDDKLQEIVMAPWGVEATYSEILLAHYWNTVWHTGQIAYIQRLLGDKLMH